MFPRILLGACLEDAIKIAAAGYRWDGGCER